MKALTLGVLFLLVFAAPVVAEEVKKDEKAEILGVTLLPAVLVLLALPLALVFRVSAKAPARIAGTLAERPIMSVLLGAGNFLLLVLITQVAKAGPATRLLSQILWMLFLLVAVVGMTGVAANLARRLGRGEGPGGFTLAWLLMAGLPLFPYLGLVYLLWLVTGGFGGTLLTLYALGRRSGNPPPD